MLFRSNDTATTEIYTLLYTLSLHDALPISGVVVRMPDELAMDLDDGELVVVERADDPGAVRGVEQAELVGEVDLVLHTDKGVRA